MEHVAHFLWGCSGSCLEGNLKWDFNCPDPALLKDGRPKKGTQPPPKRNNLFHEVGLVVNDNQGTTSPTGLSTNSPCNPTMSPHIRPNPTHLPSSATQLDQTKASPPCRAKPTKAVYQHLQPSSMAGGSVSKSNQTTHSPTQAKPKSPTHIHLLSKSNPNHPLTNPAKPKIANPHAKQKQPKPPTYPSQPHPPPTPTPLLHPPRRSPRESPRAAAASRAARCARTRRSAHAAPGPKRRSPAAFGKKGRWSLDPGSWKNKYMYIYIYIFKKKSGAWIGFFARTDSTDPGSKEPRFQGTDATGLHPHTPNLQPRDTL